ncbi:MAG: carboxypeptidase regulatory-like domain-containing protein, partial [Mucilaginibacter sp.]
QVLNDTDPPIAFQPERGLEITGTAKSLLGKPLANASVTLLSTQTNQFSNTLTDDKGNFRFSNLVFADTTRFILQAASAKGSNNTKLTYENDKPGPDIIAAASIKQADSTAMISYLQNSKNQQADLVKYGPKNARALKEVKIRAIKEDDQYETQSLAGTGHADQVWHRSDIHGGGTLSDQLDGVLRGIGFKGPGGQKIPYYNGPMLVVMDGTILNSAPGQGVVIDNYLLSNVETVEVLKGASASIYGMNGASGVLVITSRKGSHLDPKDIASVGVLPISARGYYKAREFYSPKYGINTVTSRPDLRSTIYWNPELITDNDGNVSFTYYNSDGHGTYRLVIEGIDEKGNLGRQVYVYRVE